MSRPDVITPEALGQTIGPNPPQWPISYDHLPSFDSREDIVPNRLARHMGPLLGLPYPRGPYSGMSWQADYMNLSSTEIRQGFLRGALDSQGVPLKETNTIVAASLSKYGPSRRDAAALTGINRLFAAQTESFVEAIGSPAFRELPAEEKVRSWSGLLMGSLWSQPLLFFGGQQAHALQNAQRPFEVYYPDHLKDQPKARCEVQPPGSYTPGKYEPFDFNLISDTFLALGTALEAGMAVRANRPPFALLKDDAFILLTRSLPGKEGVMMDRDEAGRTVLSPVEKMAVVRDVFAERLRREVLVI